jgi:hypothetical protein
MRIGTLAQPDQRIGRKESCRHQSIAACSCAGNPSHADADDDGASRMLHLAYGAAIIARKARGQDQPKQRQRRQYEQGAGANSRAGCDTE